MEYGKFKSAEELLKGYEELERSFTQKCQQLADMQKNASGTSETPPQTAEAAPSDAYDAVDSVPMQADADSPSQVDRSAADLSVEQIRQYLARHPELSGLLSDAQQPTAPKVMTGGGNVSLALPNRPRTMKEASDLAKKYFN